MKIGQYLASALSQQGQQIGTLIGHSEQAAWTRKRAEQADQLKIGQFLAKLMDMRGKDAFNDRKQTALENNRKARLTEAEKARATTDERSKLEALAQALSHAGLTDHAQKVLTAGSLDEATKYLQDQPDIQEQVQKEFNRKEGVKAYTRANATFDATKRLRAGEQAYFDQGDDVNLGPAQQTQSPVEGMSMLDKYAPAPQLNISGKQGKPGAISPNANTLERMNRPAKPPNLMPIVTQAMRDQSFQPTNKAFDPKVRAQQGLQAYLEMMRNAGSGGQ